MELTITGAALGFCLAATPPLISTGAVSQAKQTGTDTSDADLGTVAVLAIADAPVHLPIDGLAGRHDRRTLGIGRPLRMAPARPN